MDCWETVHFFYFISKKTSLPLHPETRSGWYMVWYRAFQVLISERKLSEHYRMAIKTLSDVYQVSIRTIEKR